MKSKGKPLIIEFPKIIDPRGNLSFIEYPRLIPFKIERTFWTYDVPGGDTRGGHAYKEQQEIIIALSGSFYVVIKNVRGEEYKFHLNRSYYGLLLPPLTWRHMEDFSTNSVSLHLSSMKYNPEDYIRDFKQFQKYAK